MTMTKDGCDCGDINNMTKLKLSDKLLNRSLSVACIRAELRIMTRNADALQAGLVMALASKWGL